MTKKPNLADALRSEQRVYQFKLLALEKDKPMRTLFCEAMNKIFIESNRPPIAK